MAKVIVASDGSGFGLKKQLKSFLLDSGYEIEDVGQQTEEKPVTHIQAARNLAHAIRREAGARGIILCGTAAGASMCVNKFRGMYCVACESVYTAANIALINNANVLALGARVVGPENACAMARAFLESAFAEGFAPERKARVEALFREMRVLENETMRQGDGDGQ